MVGTNDPLITRMATQHGVSVSGLLVRPFGEHGASFMPSKVVWFDAITRIQTNPRGSYPRSIGFKQCHLLVLALLEQLKPPQYKVDRGMMWNRYGKPT